MEIISPPKQDLLLIDVNFHPLLKIALICLQVGGEKYFLFFISCIPSPPLQASSFAYLTSLKNIAMNIFSYIIYSEKN